MFHAQVRFSFYGKLFRVVFRTIPDSYFCYRIFDLHSERKRYLQNLFSCFYAICGVGEEKFDDIQREVVADTQNSGESHQWKTDSKSQEETLKKSK